MVENQSHVSFFYMLLISAKLINSLETDVEKCRKVGLYLWKTLDGDDENKFYGLIWKNEEDADIK